MDKAGFVWQCECGHIEHGNALPEDCPKCLRLGKFNRVPEEMIEEKVAEEVRAMSSGEYNDEDED